MLFCTGATDCRGKHRGGIHTTGKGESWLPCGLHSQRDGIEQQLTILLGQFDFRDRKVRQVAKCPIGGLRQVPVFHAQNTGGRQLGDLSIRRCVWVIVKIPIMRGGEDGDIARIDRLRDTGQREERSWPRGEGEPLGLCDVIEWLDTEAISGQPACSSLGIINGTRKVAVELLQRLRHTVLAIQGCEQICVIVKASEFLPVVDLSIQHHDDTVVCGHGRQPPAAPTQRHVFRHVLIVQPPWSGFRRVQHVAQQGFEVPDGDRRYHARDARHDRSAPSLGVFPHDLADLLT